MTDNEIFEAVKTCSEGVSCMKCPLKDDYETARECMECLMRYAFDMIVKQQKEIEQLTDKHWSECRQIAHYDDELNCKDGRDWNRTIGV